MTGMLITVFGAVFLAVWVVGVRWVNAADEREQA